MKKVVFLISTLLMLICVSCSNQNSDSGSSVSKSTRDTVNPVTENTKDSVSTIPERTKEIDKAEIGTLVNSVLEIQYTNSNNDMNNFFTKEFSNSLDSHFYKKDLSPYKIKNDYILTLNNIKENEFTVSVRVSDKKGEYTQVIHFIESDGKFKISAIEYDI